MIGPDGKPCCGAAMKAMWWRGCKRHVKVDGDRCWQHRKPEERSGR